MVMKQQSAAEWRDEKYARAFSLTEAIPFWNTLLREGDYRFDEDSLQLIIAARERLLLEIKRAKIMRLNPRVGLRLINQPGTNKVDPDHG